MRSLEGRRAGVSLWVAAVALAALGVPAVAVAHPTPICVETWNPAQQPDKFTGVPGGWSTAPGTTNPSTPQNPDGFFFVGTPEVNPTHDLALFDGCPGLGGLEEGNGTGELITTVESGTAIKYTEANGKAPGFKPMAGNNGEAKGNADYIYIHVWGQGDLWVCDAMDTTLACTCCYVPPPPYTPPLD